MPTQNVSLTSNLQTFVTTLIEEGEYTSVSEVHREALRNLRAKKERESQYKKRVNQLLEEGRKDIEAGRVIRFSDDADFEKFFDELEDEVEAEFRKDHA